MAVKSEIEVKKNGKSLKDIKKFYQNLDRYQATAGIHKDDGQKLAPYTDTRHKDVKLITKACKLEFGGSYTPIKDEIFKSYLTSEWFMLKAGKTYVQEPRPFIRLSHLKDAKLAITQTFQKKINGYENSPVSIFIQVAKDAAFWQRSRIYTNDLKPENQPMTIKYKGFDHPGFMTGQLVDNIKGKASKK